MSKFSFEKIREQNPLKDATNTYVITDRERCGFNPALVVRHAGDGNQAFMDLVMAQALKGEDDADLSAEERKEKNIDALVKSLIVDWVDVFDDNDKKVKFSEEACRAFLDALNPMKVGMIFLFCQNEANFTASADGMKVVEPMPEEEAAETAKNSQGDSSSS